MMNKKGVELSMNVIIIAAIGLLVLIILAVLVINSSGRLQGGISGSCSAKGGVCKASCAETDQRIEPTDPLKPLCQSGECCGIFTTDPNL